MRSNNRSNNRSKKRSNKRSKKRSNKRSNKRSKKRRKGEVEGIPCITSIGSSGVVSCFLLIVRFSRATSPISE